MQCNATNRAGKQCGGKAIIGATVCRLHGGNAPQVRAAALARIQALVPTALGRYEKILKSGEDNDARYVARDILDRAGYKEADKLQISGPEGGPLIDLTPLRGSADDALDKLGEILANALKKFPDESEEDLA